ncbi:sodium:proton antiporter ['Osedax' symbiont bacterium Rs2_46_30_T18]|nr:sodium:proton antiporter ['Osedax' symbiont bacterium Rs2_46_30_T18]
MEIVIEITSALCLLIGSFLCVSGGVGILRFPDFYTRIHAVGVTDTLGASMILVGLMLQSQESLVVAKLLLILLMTLFINPTATHALAKAAFHNGLMPLLSKRSATDKEP